MEEKGLTFQIVIGKWSKPAIRCSKSIYGVCLGWIAFSIIPKDMEVFFSLVVKKMIEQDKQLEDRKYTAEDMHEMLRYYLTKCIIERTGLEKTPMQLVNEFLKTLHP